jgi:hypothetical protein
MFSSADGRREHPPEAAGSDPRALPRGAVHSLRNIITRRYGVSPAIFIVPSLSDHPSLDTRPYPP